MPTTGPSRKQPDEDRPEFFIDRDLGRYKVPEGLRDMGLVVHTMYEVYGAAIEQSKEDPDWISDASTRGWVILSRDKLRRKGERPAIVASRARVFRVARAAKNANEQVRYIRNNIAVILRRSKQEGPFIYRIDENDVEKVFPKGKGRRRH